ncbi:MAG TPA: 4Fe-4S binding protein [Kiritimatiellia bacterium]|nr:4Fe-4S binding protein [Kiritimatiellia bacterium]HRU70019.1 4Fe-4S binding protein [Kiritimatiellia bacterium]
MKRKIVTIDKDLCNGCGLCVNACHEGALKMVDGKATLISDSYCDGLGDCLPECPTGAIRIVEREAAAYDEAAVAARMAAAKQAAAAPATPSAPTPAHPPFAGGCPGRMAKAIVRPPQPAAAANDSAQGVTQVSALVNWPVQIKLVPVNAPYLNHAALLIAADCTAFAYPDIHRRFMTNKVTMIGCPKLDEGDYTEKLTAILKANEIRSVTVLRMEVPCCAGIANAAKQALINSGKMIPWHIVTIATDGTILEE